MSEVQGRPPSTLSMERRFGIAISIALILGGGWWALTDLTEDSHTSNEQFPVHGNSLVIDSGSTDVEIHSGDVSQITVTRKINRNIFGSEPKDKYQDGTLELGDAGCGFLSFSCQTDYVIVVPKALKVTAQSRSGDLQASDLPGGAELKSSSGDIEVHRIDGELRLESSSGDLEGHDLTAGTVTTKSSSGSVEVDFGSAPSAVQVKSSSGDVTIRLPSDDAAYRVETHTSSGDDSTTVKTDPASDRSIKADTSSGDITVEHTDN
jgi:Putative adhesin